MARKLNKALVAAVASVAILGGGAYLAAPQIIKIMRPVSKLVAEGDAAAAKGEWEAAALSYGKAASRAGNNIDLQLKYADALEYTVRGDIEKLRNLRQTQAQILANDPRSVPALRGVLAYQKLDVQTNAADTAAVRSLVGTAERLEKLVPDDREARLARVTAVLEPYARNLQTQPEEVDAQRDAADKLLAEKPDDIEAAVYVSQFRLLNLARVAQQGDAAQTADTVTKVMAFADDLVAKSPNNAGVWQLKADSYRWAAYVLAKDDAKRAEYGKVYYDALQKSADLVPADNEYAIPIRTAALRQLELRDVKAAEAGYRKLVNDRPDDRQPRIMLAEFLARQPARRDDAIAVLDAPFKPVNPPTSLKSINQRFFGMIEKVRKTSIRLGSLATIADPAERKKRLDTVEAEYKDLSSDPDISQRFKAALGRLKGGIEIAQNKVADGVATLDAAIKQMNPDSSSPIEQDLRADALMEFAQAQLRLNQTTPARQALQDLIGRRPENLTARALLTDIYITERNTDSAGRELAVLERVAGDAELVKRMRVRLDAIQGKLDDSYTKMPESNRAEQFLKLQAAATLTNNQEVARLAKVMVAANAVDPDGVTAASQALVALGQKDEAVAIVNAALKAKPDDTRFQNLAAGLTAQTQEQRDQLTRENIEKIADPYAKALALGSLARQQGRPADAIEAYKTAQKLKPEEARAFDAQFQVAMLTRRFADAEAVLGDLARTNADQADGALRRVQLAGAKAAVEPDADRRAALYKDAVAQGQAVAQQHSELAVATLTYAQLLAQSGDIANAIDQYSQTLDKSPMNIDAMLGIAGCLLRTDRRAEAADRVKAVQVAYPDDPRTVDITLDYDLRFGDPAKAVDTLSARVDKAPDDAMLTARLGVALEQVAGNKGETDGKPFLQRAADVYAKAFARFPQDLRFLNAYAEVQRKLGNAAAGEQAIEKAASDPANANRPELPQLLADAYVRSGKTDDAVRVLVNIVNATKPAPTEAVVKLAGILAKQNKMADALTVLDLRKDDAAVGRQRAQLLIDAGDGRAATEAVDTLIATSPDAETYVVAAFVALRTNEWDKAEGFANKVLAERPTDVAALYYRGQARTNKQSPDLDGALADLTKARDTAPSSPDIRLALADVYGKRNDRDAMINELQSAWNNDKNSRVVLLRLVEAYSNTTPPSWSAVDRVFEEAKKSPKLANDFDVLITHAESYTFRDDTPRAVAAGRAALAVAANDTRVQQRYLELLIKAKAWRDIVADTAQVQGEKPEDFWVWRARGVAYQNLDQKSDAEKALGTAFKIASTSANPNLIANAARAIADTLGPAAAAQRLDAYNDVGLRLMTAELVRDSGDIAGATARIESILTERDKLTPPLLRRALNAAGLLYLQASPANGVKARAAFEDLQKQGVNDAATLNNLACAILLPDSGGTPAEALKIAERAYQLANVSADSATLWPVVADTYGWALVKNNRATEGIDILRRAGENAAFPDVFLHLAEATLAGGDLSAAESALTDAKTQLDAAERRKQFVDPAMKAKYTQLSDEVAKKRAGGAS